MFSLDASALTVKPPVPLPTDQQPISFSSNFTGPELCTDINFTKKCCTPGCTFKDFHNGPHSIDIVGNKRHGYQPAIEGKGLNSTLTLDSRGLSGYGGLCKTGHREVFVYACRDTTGLVAYLDGPDAALTSLLLARGVAQNRLVPFNLSTTVAKAIETKCPGVKCRVQDICEAMSTATQEDFSAVWFDMCGTDFGGFNVGDLTHCAEYKFFTLSCRQLLCSDQLAVLCARLVQAGEKIVERTLYTGCSGKAMNMVFVVSKRSTNKKVKRESDSSDDCGSESTKIVNIGTIVRVPLATWKSNEFVEAYGFRVFDDKFLMGAVHSQAANDDSGYRLSFQLKNGGSMLCSSKYSRLFVFSHSI